MGGTFVPVKLCTVCGCDCSHIPRMKDDLGRYSCKSCFEKANARPTASTAVATRQINASARTEVKPQAAATSDVLDLRAVVAAEASAMGELHQQELCPACRKPMPAQARLCTMCGYDIKSHQRLRPIVVNESIVAAKRRKGGGAGTQGQLIAVMVISGLAVLAGAVGFIVPESLMVGFIIVAVFQAIVGISMLVCQVSDGQVGWAVLTFFFALPGLLWILLVTDRRELKVAYLGSIVAFLMWLGAYSSASERPDFPFFSKDTSKLPSKGG